MSGLDSFHPVVAEWFAERFGAPTAAQRRGWPEIAAGRDTLIAAPTGSGKTLAAFLWCVDDLLRRGQAGTLEDRTYVVYVSPLKALSHDIHVNLQTPLAELRARMAAGEIRVAVRTGDTPAHERRMHALTPPHILVTTPESLYILLTTKRGRAALAGVRTVIVDEIHAVADDRRGAHLALSLERLDALAIDGGPRAQRIGLSATQHPIELVGQFLTGGKPCVIVNEGHARAIDLEIAAHGGDLGAVTTHEQWAEVEDQIATLAGAHKTTIVFTNTRRLAERIAHALTARLGEGLVAAHHGALARNVRHDAERRLREGTLKVIVATASLELGIDVGAVELVVQIGTPRAIATLLQRVGRAGHATQATPKGRLFAMTRDDLVECAALVRALRARRLDALEVPSHPLDVLAQQLVATCASEDQDVDALFALVQRAFPYRNLPRGEYDAILDMLSEGVSTRKGRSSAHLHRDRVGNRVMPRRSARLAAILSGGAIPDRADYDVIVDPEGTKVGTLDEDFAIETAAGSIIQLGNMSWRVKRVAEGKVRVEDAHGQPPTIPFWLGEGPSRTTELSEEVSTLRAEIEARLHDRALAEAWVMEAVGLSEPLTKQLVDYLQAAHAVLGALPTMQHVVAERFFDEGGGMQLVIHAPFGARINRAWGMALRKSFCRAFDFELQAAATDDGIVLSLGEQHSFPLDVVPRYVPLLGLREILVQAALQAPMFETRWRWNAARSLSVLRFTGRGKVPAQLLRMRAADLLAAVFPQAVACQDNAQGPIEAPDHPLVEQALRDCLTEVMDHDGLRGVLAKLHAGTIVYSARELPEPSPMAAAILNANPYAFLDDAPLEERRTRAVSMRRGLPADLAAGVGALDVEAINTVRRDAMPPVRDAEELHDLLCLVGALPEPDKWHEHFDWLAAARRVTRMATRLGAVWVAAERLPLAQALYGEDCALSPPMAASPGARGGTREEALVAIARGCLEHAGPITEAALASTLHLDPSDAAIACALLEGTGLVLRGRFTPGETAMEWCDRRLLARIHSLTLGRLRREIQPVTPADLLRFLGIWQHATPGRQLHGLDGLETVIAQLQGFEAPVAAWEGEILPARIAGYQPGLLDELCQSGELVWGRRGASAAGITTRATPIALWLRSASSWMVGIAPGAPVADAESAAAVVERTLRERGALFHGELAEITGLLRTELDQALWALVASGRVTADGFAALRALAGDDRNARVRRAGRWSLLDPPRCAPEVAAEKHARQLLTRYGVVLREVCGREELPPWRDLLRAWRLMEMQGEIRGGRFVDGFVGEQFALPEAVEVLRATRRDLSATVASSGQRDPLAIRALQPPPQPTAQA